MTSPDRFEDRRLREEALKAFVKALHTDRMVAVTGAMSTRALGYPSWDEFVQAYAIVAEQLAGEIRSDRERRVESKRCFEHSASQKILRSGEALLRQAVAIGTSKGYHQALDHLRRARNANPPMPNRTDISISP